MLSWALLALASQSIDRTEHFWPNATRTHQFLTGSVKEYSMRAQSDYLTRGLYALSPGDYVNIVFRDPDGFIIVSEPAGGYYINVAADCTNAGDQRCRWYHTTTTQRYFLTGSAMSVGQITALTAGTFQLTVGYFTSRCCELVVALANGSWNVRWDVSAQASGCFVHTARLGTLVIDNTYIPGNKQSIRAYDFHSFRFEIETGAPGTVIEASDGIGALVLNNKNGNNIFRFSFGLEIADFSSVYMDLDYLPESIARRLSLPSWMTGEADGYLFQTLAIGGCVGIVCDEEQTSFGGNSGGVPTKSDGDPIYEDLVPITAVVTIAITIIILMGVVMAVMIFLWRKCRAFLRRREQLLEDGPTEEWNEEDTESIAYPPMPAIATGPEISDPYAVGKSGEGSELRPAAGFDPPVSQVSPYGGVPITFPIDSGREALTPAWPV
jgi:hypothetical protein